MIEYIFFPLHTVCPNGHWGKDCLKNCQCQNNGLCNSINGECDCPPGWIGDYCDIGENYTQEVAR